MTTARSPVRGFFAAMLIGVGALIATLCGLCTMIFVFTSLSGPGGEFSGPDMIPVALIVGGVPAAIGALLLWLGLVLAKPQKREQEPSDG